jgi:hypothetical protein
MVDEKQPPDEFGSDSPAGEPGSRGFVVDAVRRIVLGGMGALFLTEEGVRKLARDWKLPKEVIGYALGQAQGAKDEILRIFSEEVRRFLESEVVRRELIKALTSMAIEVKAEVRLKETPGGQVVPSVQASVRPKPTRGEDDKG